MKTGNLIGIIPMMYLPQAPKSFPERRSLYWKIATYLNHSRDEFDRECVEVIEEYSGGVRVNFYPLEGFYFELIE